MEGVGCEGVRGEMSISDVRGGKRAKRNQALPSSTHLSTSYLTNPETPKTPSLPIPSQAHPHPQKLTTFPSPPPKPAQSQNPTQIQIPIQIPQILTSIHLSILFFFFVLLHEVFSPLLGFLALFFIEYSPLSPSCLFAFFRGVSRSLLRHALDEKRRGEG